MSEKQGPPPPYQEPPPPYQYVTTPVQRTVVASDGVFAREARFDGISRPNIPPPPPGAYPNTYQQMSGAPVPNQYSLPPPNPYQTQREMVVGDHAFSRHARFDGNSQPGIPPPPPGVPPNQYQAMAAHGANMNVAVNKNRRK